MNATFFSTASDLHHWLEKSHDQAKELWIGFYKKGSGKGGITYPEALDEALCFGWIDGVRKSIDGDSYMIRFTPRKPGSIWSEVNIARAGELTAAGRMQPSGVKAFDARDEAKSKQYSYENRPQELDPAYQEVFRANRAAWDFFQAQPPYYRRTACFYVMGAKKPETREKRLATLIDESANCRRIGLLSPNKPKE